VIRSFLKHVVLADYPQTWPLCTLLPKRVQPWTKRLCAMVTGHELSKTEIGYGGGDRVDGWCRWCNQFFPGLAPDDHPNIRRLPLFKSIWKAEATR